MTRVFESTRMLMKRLAERMYGLDLLHLPLIDEPDAGLVPGDQCEIDRFPTSISSEQEVADGLVSAWFQIHQHVIRIRSPDLAELVGQQWLTDAPLVQFPWGGGERPLEGLCQERAGEDGFHLEKRVAKRRDGKPLACLPSTSRTAPILRR